MTPPWVLHAEEAPETARELERALGLHPLVAAILTRRGIATPAEARRFLAPSLESLHDPFLLKGMDAAVAEIVAALAADRHIVISGDYDVDGVTSTALLAQFLTDAGCTRLTTFIPNRFDHGYGLTERSVAALLALEPALVVTVDNGITAVAEVERLRAAGVTTVVTDHHLPLPTGIPAGIVVNPLQPGCAYPFKRISGCGVTFKLVTALRKALRDRGWWGDGRAEPNLKDCLDLVAIGTVADIVPLREENRVLVHHGLAVLNRPERRPGVEALLRVSNVTGVSARSIAFQVAPRLNAAGRMADGALGVELLLTADPARAEALALQLDEENRTRRETGERMFAEAVRLIEAEGAQAGAGIVVASPDFHEGIIGIVASRLVERFHLPTVVLAENGVAFKGSARSLPGVHVTEAFGACAHLLTQFGGHAAAGGCTLPKENLAAFREHFVAACAAAGGGEGLPALYCDGRLEPAGIDERLVEQVGRLAPFGHGNEEPAFLVEQAALDCGPPRVLKEKHLKWVVDRNVEMIAWNRAPDFAPHPALQYCVTLGFNEYRGTRRIQLNVTGLRCPPGA